MRTNLLAVCRTGISNVWLRRDFDPKPVPWLDTADFADRCREGVVIDTREPEAFAGGYVRGAYSIWQGGLAPYVGWDVDHATPIYLIVDGPAELLSARVSLARIGHDRVAGFECVHNLPGGMMAWQRDELPLERENP